MRRAALSVAVTVILGFVSAVLAPSASAASGSLAGTWTSVDSDGSNQTLEIMGAGNHAYSMIYYDDSATNACDGDPARVTGPGFVDGNDLLMAGAIVCLPGGNPLRTRIDISYVYDAGTDTLTDAFGIVWQRGA